MTSKEALENIKEYLLEKLKEDGSELGFLIIKENVDVLEKLVERDTPKKPFVNILNGIREYNCGVCICSLDIPQLEELNFCPECGNRIDWS